MCMFMNSLPTNSKTAETPKRKNLAVFVRPSKEKEYYKFRLLAFRSPAKNDRDYPFIERYVHQHWTKNENGKSIIDSEVICPVTKYVKVDGNPYDSCPICKYANMNFLSWKESGYKDKESAKLNRQFGRKFEAIIPVYVRNDPNYPQNNNHFKVLIFSDKDFYKKFKQAIQIASRSACVFNGKNAVDFYMHMTQVPKIVNEGLPTQYTFNENVIDKFGFTKPDKAYDIDAITKEAIDDFPFDETYYVSSTQEELQEFYNRYIKSSNDDIPDEDVEVYNAVQTPTVKATNNIESSVITENTNIDNESSDDIDDIIDSVEDNSDETSGTTENTKPANDNAALAAESNDADGNDIAALVDGLDDLL